MNIRDFYDTPLTCAKNSFVAFFYYHSKEHDLHFVVRKSGKQYCYKITDKIANELINANNRGSYIANSIIRNKALTGHYVTTVPQAEIASVIHYNTQLNNFLSR